MLIVSEARVQQWLERTKLTIEDIDDYAELVSTAKNMSFGLVANSYDIASWIDEASTPSLIQDAISMFVAAWIYNRAYSEDATNVSSYSKWLEDKATALLSGIASGAIDLPEVAGTISNSSPSFYPNDSSIDEYGDREHAKFTMGSRF